MSYYYSSEYLTGRRIKRIVNRASTILKKQKVRFDTIAVRGHSGMLIGPPLAMEMNKSLMMVRKPKDSSHSSSKVEGWGSRQKILIVDDFISSGSTMHSIYEEVHRYCDTPKVVGILTYSGDKFEAFTMKDGTVLPVYSIPLIRPR
jgi:adenine/guanine phosphoribosyltransferase-like PRPP-binding protein